MSAPTAGTRRVEDEAGRLGLAIAGRVMPTSTRTAAEAASACGCEVGRIVKSLVFAGRETGLPVLLLVSGSNRVDEAGVAAALGEPVTRPDAAQVRAWTGFLIGGVAPLGHATSLPTYIDDDLLGYDVIWAAAGTPFAVFSVDPKALARAVGATTLRMS